MKNRISIRALAGAAMVIAGSALAAAHTPYRPSSAETVLLARPAGDAARIRSTHAVPLTDPAQRAAAAQAAVDRGHRTGDPRYFGQAQALLGPDWSAAAPALPARLVRARLLQQRHAFDRALLDLDAVLAAEPANAQARLIRASVQMVQGRPQLARRDCAALIGQSGFLVIATCLGSVNALSGQAAEGLSTIETALAREPDAAVELRIWSLTQAAEIAERLGDNARATEYFASALQLLEPTGDNDVYLKAAYADFMLAQGRAAEVQELLRDETDFDPLLLRLALAEARQTTDGKLTGAAAVHHQALQARYALAATRGDPPHWREQGLAALNLQRDTAAALKIAQQNWAEQREPADALLLLQAAQAANQPAAAQPVFEWMQATGIEDVRLKPLALALGGAKS